MSRPTCAIPNASSGTPPEQAAKHEELRASGRTDAHPRDRAGFGRFFDGLELVEPGIVAVSDWRRTGKQRPTAGDVAIYGAVGRLL
ncbi:SAM-dependent methyltransferase [Actinoplanes sp. NPDC051411]|uniref:SAM-dependent methyltransferase n=1 Tax=Actinoplanes sp. NPDC051411 TaxID=3155522 RepID=UPI00343C3B14